MEILEQQSNCLTAAVAVVDNMVLVRVTSTTGHTQAAGPVTTAEGFVPASCIKLPPISRYRKGEAIGLVNNGKGKSGTYNHVDRPHLPATHNYIIHQKNLRILTITKSKDIKILPPGPEKRGLSKYS